MYSLMRLSVLVCACVPARLLAEQGRGRDRPTERGRERKKKDRRDQMRERKAEHRAPPHSPTFLWKSSQTTAIGGRDAAQQSSTHRSAGTTLAGGKRRVREREKSMCHFGACQLDTGSSFQPAGRKSAATDLFSSPLLWIGRPSPRRASQPGL